MRAMRWRVARHVFAKVTFSDPFRKAALQDALPAAANAGDDNHRAITARLRRTQKPSERSAAAVLRVTMQIKLTADLKFAATHAFFVATILRAWRRFRRDWFVYSFRRGRRCAFRSSPLVRFVRLDCRQRPARLHARSDASPQLLFVNSEIALFFAHAA